MTIDFLQSVFLYLYETCTYNCFLNAIHQKLDMQISCDFCIILWLLWLSYFMHYNCKRNNNYSRCNCFLITNQLKYIFANNHFLYLNTMDMIDVLLGSWGDNFNQLRLFLNTIFVRSNFLWLQYEFNHLSIIWWLSFTENQNLIDVKS